LPAQSEPWISPGSTTVRHDLQILADSGLLSGPVLSWPVPWSLIDRELSAVDLSVLPASTLASASRMRRLAASETGSSGSVRVEARVSGSLNPTQLRSFEDTPRQDGEVALSATGMGERVAWRASVTVVSDPQDGQSVRPDGSYLALGLGNWAVSAGYIDRWWGPGWQGSLILSTNARPIPALAVDRIEARPFDVAVLRWLGPWRLSTFMGELESDRDYPNAWLFGLRAEIRPFPSLQIAASRTAQWCGEGRPCDPGTFWDLLIGNDNDQALADQPGNQLAGFDLRWSWPGARVPLAVYAQGIGEDEAGFLPSKYLGLFGLEVWGGLADGSWRAYVEYADTSCEFLRSPPEFGCAYTNVIYTSGYRYRGRAIGHSMDADGRSIGGGLLFLDSGGHRWELIARSVELNRAGQAREHSLVNSPADVADFALTHERGFRWGNITVSLGYTAVDSEADVVIEDGLRGFIDWRYDLR
jgi:hypothetical protein